MKTLKRNGTPAVNNFLAKSADKLYRKYVPKVSKSLKQCLLDLQEYVDKIVLEFNESEIYDETMTVEWIYKEQVTKSEESTFYKVNLVAAQKTLYELVKMIGREKGGHTNRNIKQFRHLVRDLLHDMSPFVEYFEKQKDPGFIFMRGGKNYTTSSFEMYHVARGLHYLSAASDYVIPYKESQGMVSMVIRQSIEVKTKRVLGINKIIKTRNGFDYPFKNLFDFIEKNKSQVKYDPISFDSLRKIYKWSCGYIHNGDISMQWQTDFALRYIEKWFTPGTYRGDRVVSSSIYAAFKITDMDLLKRKLAAFVTSKYSIEFLPDYRIEAMLIDTL